MTEIKLAENSGFCFGVNRAVGMVEELLNEGRSVCTYGPIIHNDQLVKELESRGARVVSSPEEVKDGEVLVLCSHGVEKAVTAEAERLGVEYRDATCPFVAKIHGIVDRAGRDGRTVLIAGDASHKEVKGIIGHCSGPVYTFADSDDIHKLFADGTIDKDEPFTVVSQTTFNNEIWLLCQKTLKKVCTNAEFFDTICNATAKRQEEAAALSAECDGMVVIGGKHSSNTSKLFEICSERCPVTVHIETADELDKNIFSGCSLVGVVAGASTPARIIKEVLVTMSENLTPAEEQEINYDEMSFGEALEAFSGNMSTDKHVKGYVLAVGPTEIQVDIGRKHAGFVPANEYSSDPNVKLEEEVKVGDVLDLIIMKTNDQEGTVTLSKKRFDAIAGWENIEKASETGEILEGTVSEVVKGGLTVYSNGVRVFIPASQATLRRTDDLTPLKGTNVRFKIIEIGRGRRVIGSIRAVLSEERKAAEEKVWENIAVGDRIKGVVKSLTGYGAFVDIGGVDGMVHISELSWQRIKNPAEVVSVGDEIEVYVKNLDPEKKKISLGYKKADENPWVIFNEKYSVGDVVEAKIVSMTTYGAFARIIPGVDGLIHISQISDRRIAKPQDELKIGEDVKVKIIEIDQEKKRVSLSIRALIEEGKASEGEAAEADSAAETEPAPEAESAAEAE